MQTDIGNFTYSYDTGNRLTGITNHKSETFGFSYDTGNRLTGVSRPGSDTAFNFDDTNFLTSIVHQKTSGTNINTFSYTKDLIGNRKTASSSAGTANYNYDDNNQLTQGTNPESLTENFTYDSNGNRLTDDFGSYTYDANSQRLTEDYRYLYFYDENGNLSSKNSKTDSKVINYVHNSENQLVGIDYFDGATPTKEITYVYDALGRRVKKQVTDLVTPTNSFTRKYVYDGNEILAEFDTDNKLLATYTHSTLRTDDVLAVDVATDGVSKGTAQTAQSYFYIKDGQGTIVDIVDGAGTKLQHHIYSAFGELVNTTDASGNVISGNEVLAPFFTYTNREYDVESGLYHYRARTYDASIGRFIEVDPDSGSLGSTASLNNKYSYVSNNPIIFSDPSGKIKLKSIVAGFLMGPLLAIPYIGARLSFLDGKLGSRIDNVIIASSTVGAAIGAAPVTAISALLVTGFQNRNKRGNFFDNLGDFTTDFAINFAIAFAANYVITSGTGIQPNGIRDITSNLGAATPFTDPAVISLVVGIGFKVGSEILCRSKILPDLERPFEEAGLIADRGRTGDCR